MWPVCLAWQLLLTVVSPCPSGYHPSRRGLDQEGLFPLSFPFSTHFAVFASVGPRSSFLQNIIDAASTLVCCSLSLSCPPPLCLQIPHVHVQLLIAAVDLSLLVRLIRPCTVLYLTCTYACLKLHICVGLPPSVAIAIAFSSSSSVMFPLSLFWLVLPLVAQCGWLGRPRSLSLRWLKVDCMLLSRP